MRDKVARDYVENVHTSLKVGVSRRWKRVCWQETRIVGASEGDSDGGGVVSGIVLGRVLRERVRCVGLYCCPDPTLFPLSLGIYNCGN
jgi:hypothetical protein